MAAARPPAWAAGVLTPVLVALLVVRGILVPIADRFEFDEFDVPSAGVRLHHDEIASKPAADSEFGNHVIRVTTTVHECAPK